MTSARQTAVVAAVVAAGATAVGIAESASGDQTTVPSATSATRIWTTLEAFRAPRTARLLPARLLRSFAAPVFIVPIGVPVGSLNGFQFFLIPGRDRHVCLLGVREGRNAGDYGVCGTIDMLTSGSTIYVSRPDRRATYVSGILPDGYTQVRAGSRKASVESNVFLMKVDRRVQRATATGAGVSSRTIVVHTRVRRSRG
jgi:hypothetical protein